MKKRMLWKLLTLTIFLALVTCIAEVKYPSVDRITISPETANNLLRGESYQFTATVHGENKPPQTVTWSLTGNNSYWTTISTNGLLRVASEETATSLTIRAVSTFDKSKTANANANITVTVTGVVVSPSSVNVYNGGYQDFTATVNGSNNPPQTVTWSLTGNNSSSTSINSSGRLTVANNETATSLVVRATSTYDTNISGTANAIVSQFQIGDIITFGTYQWRVLDIQAGRALLISQNLLEQRVYHTSNMSITWENCDLRAYLNGTFYNTFSVAHRNRIVQVTNQNLNNPSYGTPSGNPTQDRIFLLSISEAQGYFSNNADRIATFEELACWWWLRSPGRTSNHASHVTNTGSLDVYGSFVANVTVGVRPALWLNL